MKLKKIFFLLVSSILILIVSIFASFLVFQDWWEETFYSYAFSRIRNPLGSVFVKLVSPLHGVYYRYYYLPTHPNEPIEFKKPVIYLYPTKIEEVEVKLDYKGRLIASIPKYNQDIGGWKVSASPNGELVNNSDGGKYKYLFWEAKAYANFDLSEGFLVEGVKTGDFLREKLSFLGLTPVETEEFLTYWLEKVKDNQYNLVHFAGQEYLENFPLKIIPKEETMIRVFVVFKPLKQALKIKPQVLKSTSRKGFTVVEWGGIILTN